MNYLKYFWITQLLGAILLIQFVGQGEAMIRHPPWWNFGFPNILFMSSAFDSKEAAWSSKVFCFSQSPADFPDYPKSVLGCNRGIFLWENWDTLSGWGGLSCLNYSAYTFYFIPFNEILLPNYTPYYLHFQFYGCTEEGYMPYSEVLADYVRVRSLRDKFMDAVIINILYILLLSSALCYIGFSQTFTQHKIRWMAFFVYTQLMILNWLWKAVDYYRVAYPSDRWCPHFNWLFGLLETLNYIAILVFLVCVLEWSWYGIKCLYLHCRRQQPLQENEG